MLKLGAALVAQSNGLEAELRDPEPPGEIIAPGEDRREILIDRLAIQIGSMLLVSFGLVAEQSSGAPTGSRSRLGASSVWIIVRHELRAYARGSAA